MKKDPVFWLIELGAKASNDRHMTARRLAIGKRRKAAVGALYWNYLSRRKLWLLNSTSIIWCWRFETSSS
jgi:hypothetical protein